MRRFGAQRVAAGGGGEGGDAAEMHRARQNAADMQRRYDLEQERDYQRKYPQPVQRDRSGTWDFQVLKNEVQVTVGWKVFFDGHLSGTIFIVRGNLVVFATSLDEDETAPSADQIMTAFLRGPGRDR